MSFDFKTMTDAKETESGEAVATTKFDFATMEDVPAQTIAKRSSVISKVAQALYRDNPLQRFESSLYLHEHLPEFDPNESFDSYQKKVADVLAPREEAITKQGIGKVLAPQINMALGVAAVANPIETAISVGAYIGIDKVFNLPKILDEKFPNTAPEVRDIAEIADFALKGGIIGKGLIEGKNFMKSRMDALGIPRNVNVSPEVISTVKDSGNLLPEEKADMLKTLGIKDKHVQASLGGNVPINIPTSKMMDLAEKPYWEIAKHELLQADQKQPTPFDFDLFGKQIEKPIPKAPQDLIQELKYIQKEKTISGETVKRLKDFIGIDNVKKSTESSVKNLVNFVKDLNAKDTFLTEKQLVDLKDVIKEIPNFEVTPKRIVLDKFGEKTEILGDFPGNKIIPELVPTVDIKQGHPLVKKIVENVSEKMIGAEDAINQRNKELDGLVTKAEKSRDPLLPLDEKLRRKVSPQNKEIFQALSGESVQLTKEESSVVAYLKDFFARAKEDLALDKYRKNYVTHLEKPFVEKVLNYGLMPAIKSLFSDPKGKDLPIDIMLELENIIGSEKFFKYALERKGGVDPTTNIRSIINQYSRLYETKKALDQILPEAQSITKNLLQGKSAVWMKKYLQNLKGRGLDNNFKNGPMGWLAKTADAIVDIEYLKLLGLNWKSPIKNIVAGEVNSWIYQDFGTYLTGKQRVFSDPKKAYGLAMKYGALEGTYSDYAQKGIGSLKKVQDWMMVGQKAGEVEIRSSIFASMLSEKEWKTGEVSPTKFNEIKDVIAKTQGVFSKWDTPLLLQTWYGRMLFNMNRWRITNASLLTKIVKDAALDIKAGNFKTQNVSRLVKMSTAYGVGMYIGYQFTKAGYKTASQITESMAQTIDGINSLFTKGEMVKMIKDNPPLDTLQEISNSIQNFAAYLHIPGARSTKEKGIEDTYIASVETIKDAKDFIDENV